MRAKNKPATVMADGIRGCGKEGYSIRDNFTQRICRSVILTAYSIAHFRGFVKGIWTNFEEFLVECTEGVDKWGKV